MSSVAIENLGATSFDAALKSSETVPLVVDFWANWCGPCKAIAPMLHEVADELAGKVKIAKVDVDENGEIAARYNIRAIPTLLFVKGGVVVKRHTGALTKDALLAEINAL